MGRPKKPTAAKILNGTFRKDRDGPRPNVAEATGLEIPDPPKHLEEIAAQQWKLLAPLLVADRVLYRTDWNCLEIYCNAYQRYQQAMEEYGGQVSVVGAMGGKVKNPALTAIRESEQAMSMFGAKLGLDPSSRASLNVGKAPGKQGALGSLLQPRRGS